MTKAPMNPLAGPSGPGDKSTRTDQLTLGSAFYADDLAELNTAAPKSKTRGVADNVGGRPANPMLEKPVTTLFSPSQKPTQNILAGVDAGSDVGSSALLMKKSSVKLSDTLAPMLAFDTTGEIGILYQDALSRGD
jgi:hypothetical protein